MTDLSTLVASTVAVETQQSAAVYTALNALNNVEVDPLLNIKGAFNVLGAIAPQQINDAASREAYIESLVADFSRTVSVDRVQYASSIRAEVSNRLSNQASVRVQASTAVYTSISTMTSQTTTWYAVAQTARDSIRTDISVSRASLLTASQSNVVFASAGEVTRDQQEGVTRTNQYAALSTSASSSVPPAIVTEGSRALSTCTSASVSATIVANTFTATDNGTWLVGKSWRD